MTNSDHNRDRPTLWAIVRTPDDLGRFLARRRVTAGWTQQDLAAYLDIPPRYIHEIESGKHTLAYTRLFNLLRALDIEVRFEADEPDETPELHDFADYGSETAPPQDISHDTPAAEAHNIGAQESVALDPHPSTGQEQHVNVTGNEGTGTASNDRRELGRPIHVKPRADGRWSVVRDGATRASSVHDTKSEAQRRARALARTRRSEVIVHGREGQTLDSNPDEPARVDITFGFSQAARRSNADFFADFEPLSNAPQHD